MDLLIWSVLGEEFWPLHRAVWKPFLCQANDITPRLDLLILSRPHEFSSSAFPIAHDNLVRNQQVILVFFSS